MKCRDCSEKLSDYVDGALTPAEASAMESHVAACPACQAELASLRELLDSAHALPAEITPTRDLWPGLMAQLPEAVEAKPAAARASIFTFPRFVPLAIAASVAVLLGIAAWRWNSPETPASGAAWTVTSTAGAPRVNSKNFQGEARLRVGQWLETDATSRAKVTVGAVQSIGEVSLDSNSRVRLVDTSATEHRIELARGRMSALIWAPPRLFFVTTPSATAIDLGCSYDLAVDDEGNGELRVTSGFVALEDAGRESIVPYRFMCLTRRGAGPGTPFAVDAPATLKTLLQRFDFPSASAPAPAISEILAQTRLSDAVTLWHLLGRAAPEQRGAVYDVLAGYQAPPASVTRAGILAGDATMRRAWGMELGVGNFAQR